MPSNPSAGQQGQDLGAGQLAPTLLLQPRGPACPEGNEGGGGGGGFLQPGAGGFEWHLPPSDHLQLPKAGWAQAVTKQPVTFPAQPGSSGCVKAAIKASRSPAFCALSSSPAPSSARDELHGATITLQAPAPWRPFPLHRPAAGSAAHGHGAVEHTGLP